MGDAMGDYGMYGIEDRAYRRSAGRAPHAGAVGRPAPDRAAVLRAEIRRAQDELHRLESVPDPAGMEPGTVLRYRRWFGGGPADGYVYVALLARAGAAGLGGRWYLTGRQARPLTHAEFREVLAQAVEGSIEHLAPVTATPPWGRTEERLALADELENLVADYDAAVPGDHLNTLLDQWRAR